MVQTLILIFITMRCDWEKEVTQFFLFVAFGLRIYVVYFKFFFLVQLFHVLFF